MGQILGQMDSYFSLPFFTVFGGISSVIVIAAALYSGYLFWQGVFPVLWRLGHGLSSRKIAVFADSDKFDDLKKILIDSGLFKEKNIIKIGKESIRKADDISLRLMHWDAYKDELQEILRYKKDMHALIVYAPQNEDRIGPDDIDAINKNRNTIIVNFRGRLLNDVLTSMITTGYQKK
ncbi:MAG: hypothetical protein ISR54_10330 [Chlorobium phaeobacteroides]|uniref:Uncharacterized protein n=1 Tax=Chlorobium phaeobacteroides (strain BS1) TaxID=331678 RepID=B3EIY1_CHLPB|nr:hypothetical protein [Chlorobium phaeobacteroides]